jgi:hypoxanthine phosphoribosyltransferase
MEPATLDSAKITVYKSADEIAVRIAELGAQINRDYAGRTLVLVGVLKGSFMFLADLIRHLTIPVRLEFVGAKSYEGTSSSGEVQLTKDLDKPIAGEHVLLVEDIIDTGLTLQYLLQTMANRQPESLKTAAFLDKPSRRKPGLEDVRGDYIGFTIPNAFVIGYGLDYEQQYRNLKDLCILNQ